jgi:hypothetical protein
MPLAWPGWWDEGAGGRTDTRRRRGWLDDDATQDEIREGTLAGKLERLTRLQAATSQSAAREAKLVALLATANDSPCPAFSGARGGQVG